MPLPTATDDHQRKNAEVLVAAGAAVLIDQRELTGERLADGIARAARRPGAAAGDGGARARRLARPDAAKAHRRSRARAGGCDGAATRDARAHAADSLRRHRRHRHERHRRAAREPRLRGQRVGRASASDVTDGSRRSASRSRGPRRRRTSATRTSSSSRRRCSRTTRRSSKRGARGIPVIPRAEMLAELMRLRFGIADRRRARQDDDHVDDRAGARAGRARSDGGHRRPAERVRQQRAARAGRLHGGRGGRERSVVPEAVAGDRGDHQHRSRAHGSYGTLERCSRRSWTSPTGCRSTARSIACVDDRAVRALLPRLTRRVITYGLDERDADVVGDAAWRSRRSARAARVHGASRTGAGRTLGALQLAGARAGTTCRTRSPPWRWAGARCAVRPDRRGARGLPRRRAPLSERAAKPAASRSWTTTATTRPRSPRCSRPPRAGIDRRLVVVFQPHRYTRTRS